MTRRRWDLLRGRSVMRHRGAEAVTSSPPLYSQPRQIELGLGPPVRRRRQMSRAELRALGENLLAQWRTKK
jgi:hypothetical protein